MSPTNTRRPRRNRLAMAAGALVAVTALFAVIPSAAASENAVRSVVFRPGAPVAVTVTHAGRYLASLCVTDILEGRCQFDVRRGQTREFEVKPPAGTPVNAWVVPARGGYAEIHVVATGDRVCLNLAGTRAKPTITAIPCG
jgi:hypothetical protein